jgi:AraC family transcriptional activator of pyochelin receptor
MRGCGRSIICSVRTDWLIEVLPLVHERALPDGFFYLTPKLYSIGAAAFDISDDRAASRLYRNAKALELLCETLDCWRGGELTPQSPNTSLSLSDCRRLMQARALIEEAHHEKLTLGSISRACGLNRAKLTVGFRELFNCTVRELLSQSRLGWAAQQLRLTQRHVALIGYDAGYNNKSSFSRAFSRKFGVSPSDYRTGSATLGEPRPD